MSTRSRIGIIREKPEGGTPIVESIYCHFDGYPEGVGQMLLDNWTDEAKVNELIGLGDISSLGSVIGEKHDFDSHHPSLLFDDSVSEEERRRLEEESPYGKGWTLAYRRDRGEKDVDSVVHPIDEFPNYGQEAEYVFDPEEGLWRVRSETLNPVGWNTVAQWEGWITIPEAVSLNTASQR